MDNTLIDNSTERLSMCFVIRKFISENGLSNIKIATGYWDIPGLALIVNELKAFLEKEGTTLQLLIGREPLVYANVVTNPIVDGNFPNDFMQRDLEKLDVKDEYKAVVDLLLTNLENGKWQIRFYDKDAEGNRQFLHSKCYIFNGKRDDDKFAYGIVGSSNLTENGLWNNDRSKGNRELNYIETNKRYINFNDPDDPNCLGHNQWFDRIWEMAEPWNEQYLEQVLKPAPITKVVEKEKKEQPQPEQQPELEPQKETLSPYEVYIKYLQMQFGDIADASTDTILKSYLPTKYDALTYQMDAVKQCFYNMRHYGGFMLADVVGLGKTIVGVLVIKKFLAEASNYDRPAKVLLVLPPAVRKAWESTIKDFDYDTAFTIKESIDIITTGSIGKLADEGEEVPEDVSDDFDTTLNTNANYGLIVIDESHNFRNSGTQKYKDLDALIGNITNGNNGIPPFVGLLSATPQNNTPADLQNQIYFFQRNHTNCSLPNVPGGNLERFFAERIRTFKQLKQNSTTEESRAELDRISREIRDCVLTDIMVRRTRHDIIKRAEYETDAQALKFPVVKGPHKLEYTMNEKLVRLFSDTVNTILPESLDTEELTFDANRIGYYRYTAIQFFADSANAKRYENRNLSVERISKQLAKIMQILLVKRLESSFDAFRESLRNLLRYTENMITMLDHDSVFVCPDFDVNAIFERYSTFSAAQEALRSKIRRKRGNNIEFKAADFKPGYRDNLLHDKQIIKALLDRWEKEQKDPKLDRFKVRLETELFDAAKNNPHGFDKPRLVIFTEAKATQSVLYDYIKDLGSLDNGYELKPLMISAANRDDMQDVIRRNFDANCPENEKEDRYNVIITTEVLAEGVNLHRANVILNYDTPWNATRLMQRIGRVNRIGSKEDEVHVFNFYPSTQGNELIRLKENAYAKLQAFHTMFGEDSKVYTEEEELSESELNTMIDGEASPIEPYIRELKEYRNENPARYNQLCDIEPDNLGGKIEGSEESGKAVVCINSGQCGIVNLEVDANEAHTISMLDCLNQLKCVPADTYTAGYSLPDNYRELAQNAYNVFMAPMRRRVDNNKQREAMGVCNNLFNNYSLSDEAKIAVRNAMSAARNANVEIVNALLRLNRELQQGSLFGAEFDINTIITGTLGRIRTQAQNRTGGEAKVLFYKEN